MQRLDPTPVQDWPPDLETGQFQPAEKEAPKIPSGRTALPGLGLGGYRWDSWLSTLQKYSTYPPTLFLALHFTNTSLIPLITRSVPDSEPYLLLTRPIYQSPPLEHALLTAPIAIHIVSGIILRNIRASRRARLHGAETRAQRSSLRFWPRMTTQARLGYLLVPVVGVHVLVNRVVPLIVEGGSSGVGLGYVGHGFAKSPAFWNVYYSVLVTAGVWHVVGGWATWMGWRVTTARKERGTKGSGSGALGGYLGNVESEAEVRKRNRRWWIVNGVAAAGTVVWLAGGLGVVGLAGPGSAWEAKGWDEIYRRIPFIEWLSR